MSILAGSGTLTEQAGLSPISTAMRRYVVTVLVVTAVVAYIDRQVISILLESIKMDLHLNDTQIGLLTGLFFSGLFIVAGVPLARLSDRGNRKTIISICLAGWSLATMLCGMAQNYVQIALSRSLVAIGEAGSAPASSSIIADLFRPLERSRIFALISCGSAIGIAFGIYAGGTLNEILGWRMVFIVLGVPGLLVALIIYFTVPEPVRPPSPVGETKLSLLDSAKEFVNLASYRALIVIAIFASISAYAVLAWFPAFLIRVHGMSTGEIGLKMGTATVVGLITGNLLCGAITHRFGKIDVRWLVWTVGVGLAACVPLGVAMLLVESTTASLLTFTAFMIFLGFWAPPVTTIAVGLVGTQSRALIASTIPLYQAIGAAVGPGIVGMMNDQLTPAYGEQAIRYSLVISLVGCLVAACVALIVGRYVARDYRTGEVPVLAEAA